MEKFSWMVIKMNKKTLKIIFISVIILASVLLICLLFFHFNKEKEYNHLRKYKSNEYIPTHVAYEDLAQIYLNDYTYNMSFDIQKAYDLLDIKYREKKFNSISDFSNYVRDLKNYKIKMKKYIRYKIGKYTIFKIYDNNNNLFIFKTNGVMQYSVYLDDTTVEVGD